MADSTLPKLTLSLTVKGGADALAFYEEAFGAEVLYKMASPDGSIFHAELRLGESNFYLSCESPEFHAYAMPEGTMASCLFTIDVADCDAAFARAVEAGGHPLGEPQDFFWGERAGVIRDAWGYRWCLRQHIEDVSPEEIARRAQELFSQAGS